MPTKKLTAEEAMKKIREVAVEEEGCECLCLSPCVFACVDAATAAVNGQGTASPAAFTSSLPKPEPDPMTIPEFNSDMKPIKVGKLMFKWSDYAECPCATMNDAVLGEAFVYLEQCEGGVVASLGLNDGDPVESDPLPTIEEAVMSLVELTRRAFAPVFLLSDAVPVRR